MLQRLVGQPAGMSLANNIAHAHGVGGPSVKLLLNIDPDLAEESVVINCRAMDESIARIQAFMQGEAGGSKGIAFHNGNEEFFFPLGEVLFFATEGDAVFAHTAESSFSVNFRLYELEGMLPRYFVRASKAAIINVRHVYSVQKNITSSSLVLFHKSHKQLYISRFYYKACMQALSERHVR